MHTQLLSCCAVVTMPGGKELTGAGSKEIAISIPGRSATRVFC